MSIEDIIYAYFQSLNKGESSDFLWKIFAVIDGREKYVPSYSDLKNALKLVSNEGHLKLIDMKLYFFKRAQNMPPIELTRHEYDAAFEQYKKNIDEIYNRVVRGVKATKKDKQLRINTK